MEGGIPACLVTVEAVSGSAPRDAGTLMLVWQNGFQATIGGGQLEYLALEKARQLIASGSADERLSVPLGPEINQCCGGRVELSFRLIDEEAIAAISATENRTLPRIQIHGAGHTGKALADALALLPFETEMVDARTDVLAGLPDAITIRQLPLPEGAVRQARPQTAFVVLTHSHDLDFLITAEALARGDAAYVGMIGSATKRAVFAKWLANNGYDRVLVDRLTCPIGGTRVKDKRPEVIAALVAAELVDVFARSET